jgi:hypothetical protein
MELSELLEVHSVARLMQIQHCENEPRPRMVSPDATGRLNIFGRRFWLPLNDHQPQPSNVETDRDHVRSESDIYRLGTQSKDGLKALLCLCHLVC